MTKEEDLLTCLHRDDVYYFVNVRPQKGSNDLFEADCWRIDCPLKSLLTIQRGMESEYVNTCKDGQHFLHVAVVQTVDDYHDAASRQTGEGPVIGSWKNLLLSLANLLTFYALSWVSNITVE